jgi:hypothetical protein
MVATLILLLLTPRASQEFPWTLLGFIGLVTMHLAYWVFTHPVNKFWLREYQLKGFSGGFFRFDPAGRSAPAAPGEDDWKLLRRRWEYSHVARTGLAITSLVFLVIAVAL